MKSIVPLLAVTFLTISLGASAAEPVRVAEGGQAPLTLTGAKQAAARYLADNGQKQLRVGHAEFDRDGNVAIEIDTIQGIAVRHLLVDGRSGLVADAKPTFQKRG